MLERVYHSKESNHHHHHHYHSQHHPKGVVCEIMPDGDQARRTTRDAADGGKNLAFREAVSEFEGNDHRVTQVDFNKNEHEHEPRPTSRASFTLHDSWCQLPRRSLAQGSLTNMLTSQNTRMVSVNLNQRGLSIRQSQVRAAAEAGLALSLDDEPRKPWMQKFMLSPGSKYRAPWDMFGMLLILWDAIYIPLGVYDITVTVFLTIMEWTTRIYWTVDIPMTFTVGFFKDGAMVMDPKAVAMHYFKGTFIIDLSVVTIDWVTSGGGNAGILRVFRAARIVRLVRLLKLQKILAWIQDHTNSEYTSLVVDFLKLVFAVLILSHFASCIFWYIGSAGGPGMNWIEAADLLEKPVDLQYSATLYWGLTGLLLESTVQPMNTMEYVYSITIVVCGLIGFSTIVSRITSLLLEIQTLRADTTQEVWKLRRFFRQNKVPAELNRRIIRYLEYAEEQKRETIQWSDLPILNSLTPSLRSELRYVGYRQVFSEHPLFNYLTKFWEVALKRISEFALEEKALAHEDPLFFQGEVCTTMDVLTRGDLVYAHKPGGSRRRQKTFELQSSEREGLVLDEDVKKQVLGPTTFLAEQCLWVNWRYVGEATGSTECVVVSLNAERFLETITRYPYLHVQLGKYAYRSLRHMRKAQARQSLTDVWDQERVQQMLSMAMHDMGETVGHDFLENTGLGLADDASRDSSSSGGSFEAEEFLEGGGGISADDIVLSQSALDEERSR